MEIITMEKTQLENILLRIINFINKKETVNTYIFRNFYNNISCEFDKINNCLKFYEENYIKINLNYLLKNKNKKYLINYNNLKEFVYKNVYNDKYLNDIIENINYIYIDTLPDGEFEETLEGNKILELLDNLKISNFDFINKFELILIE